MSLGERLTFVRQLLAHQKTTGAVQPSSRYLARAMAAPLRRAGAASSDPLDILEIGPGTGAVTRGLVEAMRPGDRLDCYEINPEFAGYLKARVRDDPAFRHVRDGIEVVCAPAEELPGDARYDLVVCSVPFNNFDAGTTERLFDVGLGAVRADGPGGTFTWFEYLALPALVKSLAPAAERRRMREVQAVKQERRRRHPVEQVSVFRNLPPARVCHLRVEPAAR